MLGTMGSALVSGKVMLAAAFVGTVVSAGVAAEGDVVVGGLESLRFDSRAEGRVEQSSQIDPSQPLIGEVVQEGGVTVGTDLETSAVIAPHILADTQLDLNVAVGAQSAATLAVESSVALGGASAQHGVTATAQASAQASDDEMTADAEADALLGVAVPGAAVESMIEAGGSASTDSVGLLGQRLGGTR